MKRVFKIDPHLTSFIESKLNSFHLSLDAPKKLAFSVKKLSDYFIQNPLAKTPWDQDWCQIGYLVYFFPLNLIRAQAVFQESQRLNFLFDIQQAFDFGCGMGSGSYWLPESLKINFIDQSEIPMKYLTRTGHQSKTVPTNLPEKSVTIFSYSLTELESLPPWSLQSEALILIEPATQQDGRKLLKIRESLIEKGFHIWAPCLHQLGCPLLTHSKNDWCHDRVFFDQPEWFIEIEKHLPIKNKTLTMSYLLARKSAPPKMSENSARLIGDQVPEKGKSRQLICRGPDREFLSWLDRDGPVPELYRGEIFTISSDYRKIANEVRRSLSSNI
jgi:hypothetical protein